MNRLARISFAFLALVMVLAAMPPSAAAQIQIFSTGGYGFRRPFRSRRADSALSEGYYFIPDGRLDRIWVVPNTGGPPTSFADCADGGFTMKGGLFLPSGWGANSGKFLVAGRSVRRLRQRR